MKFLVLLSLVLILPLAYAHETADPHPHDEQGNPLSTSTIPTLILDIVLGVLVIIGILILITLIVLRAIQTPKDERHA